MNPSKFTKMNALCFGLGKSETIVHGPIFNFVYTLLILVGCLVVFGLNDPLRQYFSLYRVVSQREGEREEKGQMRVKMSKQSPPAPTARAVGPCPTLIQTSRTPRHWKFTQDHCTTRPPHYIVEDVARLFSYFRAITNSKVISIQ